MAAVGTISATDIDNVLSISLNNTVWEKETVDGEDVFKLDENGNKIVIKTEEVTPAFTYSLADYDASLGYEALAKALIKYAIAAENYKVIGVTK